MLAMFLEPFEQRFDLVGFFLEMCAAFRGGLERFAPGLALPFLDQVHVLQQGQGRVDDSGTWRIVSAGHLLDRPNQVVAVARLVGDQLEQDESQLAAFEHPPAPAAMSAAAPAAVFPEFKMESARTETETARAAHRKNSRKSAFGSTIASVSMHIYS